MIVWTGWEGDAGQWDTLVHKMPDFTVFQSFAWGEHRSRFGWRPLRLLAHEDGKLVAVAQVLTRRFPFGIGVVWIPGGPLGKGSAWNSDFRQAVGKAAKIWIYYVRVNIMANHTSELESTMVSNGWFRTSRPLSSGLSLEYSPSLPQDQRLLRCSGNWRHNLRRSYKRSLFISVWTNPDPYEMMKAYGVMQDLKNIATQTSVKEIESILRAFGKQCLIVRCDDKNGEFLALRGAIVMESKAWDIFAISSPAGRKVYASHATFWELMSQCSQRGVHYYDRGGADPINNRGVYDFKKGTGAIDTTQLGEWEYSNPTFLRKIATYLVELRGRI